MIVIFLFFSYCDECMLDLDCGFCYKMNKLIVIDFLCVLVNKVFINAVVWGRYVIYYIL